jgi:class 3 adenylate cyclase
LGEGVPFVHFSTGPFVHAHLVWRIPKFREWFERIAQRRMYVRVDARGSGLSDREVPSPSLDDYVLDVRAVVEHLSLKESVLFAQGSTGPVAIAYAAHYPEEVSHLLLWHAWSRSADARSPQLQGLSSLLETNWEMYTETFAHSVFGWSEGDASHRWAEIMREIETPEHARQVISSLMSLDANELLPKVKAPTLVLQRHGASGPDVDVARRLASSIPSARLALLEGREGAPMMGDTEAVAKAIDEFLGDATLPTPSDESSVERSSMPSGTAIILFADIVESTALTEEMGDAAFREKARELDTSLRDIIRKAEGTPVEGKLLGDGVLAVFSSAKNAIDAAVRFGQAGETVGLGLHLGIHAGDVIREGDNVFGGAVNIAARISGESEAGEVLVSDTVRGLARTSAGVSFEDRGERELKGVGEPMRVWRVREVR